MTGPETASEGISNNEPPLLRDAPAKPYSFVSASAPPVPLCLYVRNRVPAIATVSQPTDLSRVRGASLDPAGVTSESGAAAYQSAGRYRKRHSVGCHTSQPRTHNPQPPTHTLAREPQATSHEAPSSLPGVGQQTAPPQPYHISLAVAGY